MIDVPSSKDLIDALTRAGSAHHEYETNFLNGVNDEQWAGFYAAFVLGRLGDFMAPSKLSALLIESPDSEEWAVSASEFIVRNLNE